MFTQFIGQNGAGIGIGDTNDHLVGSFPGQAEIPQMLEMKRLEPTVNCAIFVTRNDHCISLAKTEYFSFYIRSHPPSQLIE